MKARNARDIAAFLYLPVLTDRLTHLNYAAATGGSFLIQRTAGNVGGVTNAT